ncbi:MAG: DUF4339 domain-containing protein [Sedimentisphaerales bacterium]
MWYYVRNSQRIGPVEQSVIEDLIQNGTIVRQTLVWKSPMSDWKQAGVTELADKFSDIAPIPPSSFAITSYSDVKINFSPESLRKLWLWFAWLLGAGLPLIFIFIGIPAIIAGTVIYYVLLYRFWMLIQDGKARTSPGKAVGFCFIPFFNFYWLYVAIVGLAKDMNLYCQERNIEGSLPSEGLALAMYITTIISCVPYIGILAAIPSLIIQIILTKQFVETSVKIMEYKTKKRDRV